MNSNALHTRPAVSKSALFIAVCLVIGSASMTQAADQSVEQLIAEAEAARTQAAALKFEWTTTAGLVNAARQALTEDDRRRARVLALRARKEARAAIAQARLSDQHWQDYIPR